MVIKIVFVLTKFEEKISGYQMSFAQSSVLPQLQGGMRNKVAKPLSMKC